MGWRTVVVSNNCKLSFKNDYLIIRNEELKMIYLPEIETIIIESGMISITSYLINEIAQRKINLIFCDEKHNPSCELLPYYGSFNTSKKIANQINWKNKDVVWQNIIKNKIHNQAMLLKKAGIKGYTNLIEYENQVELNDISNREGHAAKLYFNLLFGDNFIRNGLDVRNSALNYGYSILLSMLNREIIKKGYITPLGINHRNEFNQFNLSCDLMEIFRPLVDEIVYKNGERELTKEYKHEIVNISNRKIKVEGKEQYLSNAVPIIIKSIFNSLESDNVGKILNYEF